MEISRSSFHIVRAWSSKYSRVAQSNRSHSDECKCDPRKYNARLLTNVATAAEAVFRKSAKVIGKAQEFGIKTKEGFRTYVKIDKAMESMPNGLKIARVSEGKGRGMVLRSSVEKWRGL